MAWRSPRFGFALVSVEAGGRTAVVKGEAVFGPYCDLLGIQPVAGHLLAAADEHEPHLVIAERLWRRCFRGLHGGHVLGNDVWLPRGMMTIALRALLLTPGEVGALACIVPIRSLLSGLDVSSAFRPD